MKKKLILCNAAIIIVGFVAAFLFEVVQIQQQYQKEFTMRLDTALAILSSESDELEQQPVVTAKEVGRLISQSGQQMRISIISTSGKVIADSFADELNQNHLTRPEIQQALKSGRGYDTRMSASVGQRFYYEAVYIPNRYFIRAALPTASLDGTINRLWLTAILSMLFGIAIVSTVTGILVFHMTEPLNRLTVAARRISDGDYTSRVDGEYNDEIGLLARSFNTMAVSTQAAVIELTRKQGQLEGVLQGMADGVLAVSSNNEILFLNQSARNLLSRPTMKTGDRFEGSLFISKVSGMMLDTIQNGKIRKESLDGAGDRHFLVYVAPITGQKNTALAVITDVTRMRKLEQMRSEFVANVTHELKTPLTSIRGSIELLKSADRDEKTRRYFYDVLDIEAERLHHLIDDMLVLSQIENAKDDPQSKRMSVKEGLQNCVDRLDAVARKNEISLSLDVGESLFVSCSPMRFEQLFCNLIENAIKYNKPGGSVVVTALKQRKMVLVRVRDTGIGIAPEHFERLFERFYRVDTSRSREIGGTGLGLSIVKHLAALYGGEVGVESEVGKGSTFSVWLPLLPPEEPAAAAENPDGTEE
ncbi:MAG TPA: ATP-binding protein [Caproiciproducens sp.]|nr:ATP-binding protein [Caproiciproducens sp.]